MKSLVLSLLLLASISVHSQTPPIDVDLIVTLTPNSIGQFDVVVDSEDDVVPLRSSFNSIVKVIRGFEAQGLSLVYITESSSIRLYFKETENGD